MVLIQVRIQSTKAKPEGIHTCGMLPSILYGGLVVFDTETWVEKAVTPSFFAKAAFGAFFVFFIPCSVLAAG